MLLLHGSYCLPFLGLRGAAGDCRSICRKSRFIPAISFRVGTRSKGDFGLRGVAMTLPEVNELYGTDARCREALRRLRWPAGVECPRCHDTRVSTLKDYDRFECAACEYQFTVTSGTIFHDSHLPLTVWFLAVLLLCEAKKGMSALQLKRTLWGQHKGSYKTAWYLCHRIRAAMKEAAQPMLHGTIEIDETYVGGKPRKGMLPDERPVKQVVIGIRQRGGPLRFIHAKDATSKTIREIMGEHVSEDVDVLVTDESVVYPYAFNEEQKAKHKTINHSREYVVGDIHTNTVESAFSLLKRGIIGSWHKISAKHLPAYLAEIQFRFNRRKRGDLFMDTLRHMVTADPLTFERLTA
jgi:transposase-like protein